jgi:drug/metabolite transporter (DMT)-like permease
VKKKTWIYIGLLFAMAVWSYSYVLIKIVYSYGVPPTMLVFMRLLLASITLIIFCRITKKLQPVSKKDRRYFLMLAFFEPFLYYIGESNGLMYVSPTVGSIIIATIPLFTPFVLYLFFKEKMDKTNFFGIIISFIGVLLVIFEDDYTLSASPIGLAFMFFAVFSAFGYTVVIKNLTQKYNSFTIVTYQTAIGAILYLPLFLLSDFSKMTKIDFSYEMIVAIASLAIFATAIAYILFSSGIREIGAMQATIFANLIPVLTALLALLSGMEDLPLRKLGGVVIVIAGVFLSQSKKPFLGLPGLVWNYFVKRK